MIIDEHSGALISNHQPSWAWHQQLSWARLNIHDHIAMTPIPLTMPWHHAYQYYEWSWVLMVLLEYSRAILSVQVLDSVIDKKKITFKMTSLTTPHHVSEAVAQGDRIMKAYRIWNWTWNMEQWTPFGHVPPPLALCCLIWCRPHLALLSPFGYIWPHLALFSHIWPHLAIWHCLALYN